MIRPAVLSDVEGIIESLTRMKQRTVYAFTKVNADRARKTLRQCISGPQCFAQIAIQNDRIVGVLAGLKEQIWFADALEAKDIVFFGMSAGDSMQLVDAFCEWAFKDSRVDAVLLAQSSGIEVARTTRWFEAQGFESVGAVHRLGRWDWKEKAEKAA